MRLLIVLLLTFTHTTAFAESPERIVTIGGALTEIVYALDAQDRLVGSDTTSYYPAEAEKLPKVGYQRALSAEGILSLKPDLVILTNEAGPPPVLKQLESAGVSLLKLKAGRSLDDVKANIEAIGDNLRVQDKAASLLASLDKNNEQLKQATNGGSAKRVMFILQHGGGTPMVSGKGTAADSIIALSGATNVVSDYDGYKPLTPEAAVALKPDVILVTTQGLEQVGGMESFLSKPGIALTPAAKAEHVIAMDSLLMLGFGPRTAEAALELNKQYNNL